MQIAARQAVLHGYRLTVFVGLVSEFELANEFDLTTTRRYARDLSHVACADQAVRRAERRMIQDVRGINAEVKS